MLKFTLLSTFFLCFFLKLSSQIYVPPQKVITIPETESYIKSVYNSSLDVLPDDLSGEQKMYLKKLYKNRYETSLKFIKNGELTDNGYVYEVVDSLFQLILKANPQISGNKKVYIINDQQVNAFTMGDDLIYVHIGLLYRLSSFDELIFVLCHEIAHNELKHYQISSLNYAKNFINDSLEKAVKNASRKEIGHVSALNEVLIPMLLLNRKDSRDFEFAADSMAVSLFTNCNLSLQKAITVYEMLKLSEFERDTELIDLKKGLQLPSTMDFSRHLAYTKEASLGIFGEENDTMEKWLLSHPYPEEREKKIKSLYDVKTLITDSSELSGFDTFIRQVERDMIYSAFRSKNIGKTIFYWLNQQKKYPEEKQMDGLISFSFAILGYEKMKRREGFIIEKTGADFDENYDRVLYFLRKLKPEECIELARFYLQTFQSEHTTWADYSEMLITGSQKDFVRFKPLYFIHSESISDDFYHLIKEIYSVNRVSINKI